MVLAGWFSLGVPHTAAVKIKMGQVSNVTVIWGLTGDAGPFARWLTHLSGKLMLVVDRKPSFLGCQKHLHNVAVGCPPEREIQNSKVEGRVLSDFASEVTPGFPPYSHWSQRTTLVQCGRRLHQGVNTRK